MCKILLPINVGVITWVTALKAAAAIHLLMLKTSAGTSYSKLENSTSFTTQISNSKKFEFHGLYYWETQTQ